MLPPLASAEEQLPTHGTKVRTSLIPCLITLSRLPLGLLHTRKVSNLTLVFPFLEKQMKRTDSKLQLS